MYRQVEQPKEILPKDKFLETYSPPRLNHDEVENLNRRLTPNKQTGKKKQTNRHVACLIYKLKLIPVLLKHYKKE